MSVPKVVDLVFEGGGMKGVAFIGALRSLTSFGYQPGRILGTSVGSLFAFLLAAGYSFEELRAQLVNITTGEVLLPQHFQEFPPFETEEIDASATRRVLKKVDLPFVMDPIENSLDTAISRRLMRHPALNGLFAFLEKGGIHDPEPFTAWLETLLAAKNLARPDRPARDMTLKEFYQATRVHLSLTAADMTNPTMLILNHITTPDCPVVQAVRMATAVPLFIPPVEWQASWGLYRRQDLTGDVIVDGCFVSNFPIELFLSREELVTSLMGQPDEAAGVLGFLLDETLAVPGAPQPSTSYWQGVLNELPGLTVLSQLIETMFRAREKQIIDTASEPHIVRLPAMGYAPFSLDLTFEQIQPLLNAGYNATTAYLQKEEIHPHGLQAGEAARLQVDHTARQIINVYGNLNVHQEIGEVSGTATGVEIG